MNSNSRDRKTSARRTLLALACTAVFGMPAGVSAQGTAWPDHSVRFIVNQPPGGPSDIVLRSVLAKIQPDFKPALVLENKPGAAGNLGAGEVARAAPDGYTWLWTPDTAYTLNPHVYRQLGFKVEDLQPVMVASEFSQTLVCNPGTHLKNLAELVARAKEKPMSYASGGPGSPGHLASELLMTTAGIKMSHVPYKGPAPAMQDVISGQIECGFLAGPTVLPMVKAGKLVALAVSGRKRSALLPDVPTVAESGFPGYDATFSLALFAPKGTPRPIIDKLTGAIAAALKSPDMLEKLKLSDQQAVAASPEQSAATLAADSKKWGEVAKRIHLRQD